MGGRWAAVWALTHLHGQGDVLLGGSATVGDLREREDVERTREEEYRQRRDGEAQIDHVILATAEGRVEVVARAEGKVVEARDAEERGEGRLSERGERQEEAGRALLRRLREVVEGVVTRHRAADEERHDAGEAKALGSRVCEESDRGDE